MTKSILIREISPQGVARITLNRQDVNNALDEHLIADLTQAFLDFGRDPSVRVIILAASGKYFCAGADLNGMKRAATCSLKENIEDARKLAHLLYLMNICPKPTIALVQGSAYGGGVGLIAACDIAICQQDALFCLSEVKLGLIPAIISPYLIKAIGQRQMRRYVLTAEPMKSAEAHSLGLIHEVVTEDALEVTGNALVALILKAGPGAIKATKELIHFVASQPIDDQLREETACRIAVIRQSPEGREGVDAYLTKRLPSWQKEGNLHV